MVSASSAAATQLTRQPHHQDRGAGQHAAEAQRLARRHAPAGSGRLRVRSISASMSRSYHMLMAPAAPAATAMHSTATAASTRMEVAGREIEPDEAGEHHQRHHPRLQQRHVVARRRTVPRRGGVPRRAMSAERQIRLTAPSPPGSVPGAGGDVRQLLDRSGRAAARTPSIPASSRPRPSNWRRRACRREQRVEDDEDEEQRRGEGDVGADRGHHVPAGERVRDSR